MQFTVLIEFLIPGLATTLLALAILPCGAIPPLPESMPTGDTATALLLLVVSYPIGILVNFPLYQLQRLALTPRAHRAIVKKYLNRGVNLLKLSTQQLRMGYSEYSGNLGRRELRDVFGLLRAYVFEKNVDRLNSHHLFHEGLQRLARGMPVPLLLAAAWLWSKQSTVWELLVSVLGLLFLISLWLLNYSIRAEEELIARFFIVLYGTQTKTPQTGDAANPANRADG